MGFFDSLKGLILGGSEQGEQAAGLAGFNLGNIFLPGGMSGGAANANPTGAIGFGGSPLSQGDWQTLNNVWGQVRVAANFDDALINWDAPGGQKLTPEAQQFLRNNWGNIRRAANLGDINWQAGIVGAPAYAQPGAAGGAPTQNSTLGDLEPARGMFAGLAQEAGQAARNANPANILSLLREQAQPFEQQAQNRLNNNLFMRGRLGANDSATGEAYRGFSRGLAEADTQRQIAAMGLSDQLQTSALGRALGATQGASSLTELSTLPFDLALKLATARSGVGLGQAQAFNQSQGDTLLDAWGKFMGAFS